MKGKLYREVPIEISADEAHALLKGSGGASLIDIRDDWETSLGYIEGAAFVPPGLLEAEVGRIVPAKGSPVIICCTVGNRSATAAQRLRSSGYSNAHSIRGGMIAWIEAGYDVIKENPFTNDQLNRYSRQILLKEIGEEGQEKLLKARVLLVGAGGLGSSAGLYLAACGVGTVGIIDFDKVELSNLNRQLFHGSADVGRSKVESARASIHRINPGTSVPVYDCRLTAENALHILAGFDVVVDALDAAEAKFLLNDACFFAHKPLVFGGAIQFEGQASVFYPDRGGPCLRCLFPKPPPPNLAPT
jgi:molybdopterin/thiamine biosynthesis adenylyltransferase/rhodanese-related sulfurtransferase